MIGTRQFFGDREHDFALPPALILELERLTGQGIGGLSRRLMAGDFKLADLHQTIRLGLIGGGAEPQEAAALIAAYVETRPVLEAYALAVTVIDHVMTGGLSLTEPKENGRADP